MPGSTLRPDPPRRPRRLGRPCLLVVPALLALAGSPLAGSLLPPPLLGAQAADCPLPSQLCPPATSPPTPPPPATATLRPATTPPAAAAPPGPPSAAAATSPAVAGAASGLRPQTHDAAPARTPAVATPTSAAVQAWQVVAGVIAGLALAALLVLRVMRQRRRAALHA